MVDEPKPAVTADTFAHDANRLPAPGTESTPSAQPVLNGARSGARTRLRRQRRRSPPSPRPRRRDARPPTPRPAVGGGADAGRPTDNREGHDEIEASKAPLMDHLIELRQRLIYALIGIGIGFIICFAFATQIYNLLVWPYQVARGEGQKIEMIYTAPHEFFFTKLKLALFGAVFLAFPIIAFADLQVRRARPLQERARRPSAPICCGPSCSSSRARWSSISSSCRSP